MASSVELVGCDRSVGEPLAGARGQVLMIVPSAEGRRVDQLKPAERLPGVCDK
jgi:hypothetical protein